MVKNSLKNSDLKNKYLDNNMNKIFSKIHEICQKSLTTTKSLLPKKYTSYFDIVTKLYLDRKIEKQSRGT